MELKYTKIKGWTWGRPHRPLYRLDQTVSYYTGIEEEFRGSHYRNIGGIIVLAKGYKWDGASGGLDYNFMFGSAVHDAICDAINLNQLDSKYQVVADEIMRKVNLEQGMFKPRAYLNWGAVRLFQSVNRWQQRKRGIVI